jgi:hypothetical protein
MHVGWCFLAHGITHIVVVVARAIAIVFPLRRHKVTIQHQLEMLLERGHKEG